MLTLQKWCVLKVKYFNVDAALICISLGGNQSTQRIRVNTQNPHRKATKVGQQVRTFLLWGNSSNQCTTMHPNHQFILYTFFKMAKPWIFNVSPAHLKEIYTFVFRSPQKSISISAKKVFKTFIKAIKHSIKEKKSTRVLPSKTLGLSRSLERSENKNKTKKQIQLIRFAPLRLRTHAHAH